MPKKPYNDFVNRNRNELQQINYLRDKLNLKLGNIKPHRFSTYDSHIFDVIFRLDLFLNRDSYTVDTNDIRQWNEMHKPLQDDFLNRVKEINDSLQELRSKFKNMLFYWMHSLDNFLSTTTTTTYLDNIEEKYYNNFIVEILERWFPNEIPSNVSALIKEIKGV